MSRPFAVNPMPRGTIRTVHGQDAGYTGKRKRKIPFRSRGVCVNRHSRAVVELIGGKCMLCREAGM